MSCQGISCTNSINGLWNVNTELSVYRPATVLKFLVLFTAVCRVSLDTRLGCLSDNPNPESKKIIDAINTFFWTVVEVELRFPVWRFYKTKTFNNYIAALDSFRE